MTIYKLEKPSFWTKDKYREKKPLFIISTFLQNIYQCHFNKFYQPNSSNYSQII